MRRTPHIVGGARFDSTHCEALLIKDQIMLKFVLLVNKQGQTRLSQYFEYLPVEERVTTEADIVRKCLARNEDSVMYGPTSVDIERW